MNPRIYILLALVFILVTAISATPFVYTGENWSVSAQQAQPRGFWCSESNCYVTGTSPKSVFEYTTDWSYTGNSWDISGQVATPHSLWCSDSYCYVLDASRDKVFRYNTTWSYTSTSYNMPTNAPSGLWCSDTNCYVVETGTQTVHEYTTSFSPTSTTWDISGQTTTPTGLWCSDTNCYVTDYTSNEVFEYNASWDYTGNSWDLSAQATTLMDVFCSFDGCDALSFSNDAVYRYSGFTVPFQITIVDAYDESSINTFNASLTNSTGTYDFQTTNGTIVTDILNDVQSLFNITVTAPDYFPNTSLNVNVSSGSYQGSIAQAFVSFTCSELYTEDALTCAQSGPLPRKAGSYDDQVNVTGYFGVNSSYSLSALENETLAVEGFFDHRITITAEDYLGASLSNFTIFVNSTLENYNVSDADTGTVLLDTLQGYEYLIEIVENIPSGAERNNSIDSVTINVPEDANPTSQSYQFNLTFPSLTVNVIDESTGLNITTNTTVIFTSESTSFEKTVTAGSEVFNAADSIPSGTYSVRFENEDYADRSYSLTYNREFPQSLTAYLINSSSPEVIFILEDRATRNPVTDATITVQRFINGILTTVNVLETDITGRTAFDYLTDQEYRFQITHSDYTAKNFTLNPILFSSYTILLDSPITVGQTTGDYSGIGYVFNTARFTEGTSADLTATVSDASGSLVTYGFNLSVNGVVIDTQSGSNAYGSVLSSNVNIPETPYDGSAVIDYYYQRSDGVMHTFRAIYSVEQVNAYSNQTWVGNRDLAADIPILDRIVVVTIILAAVGALAFTFGGLTTAAIGMMLIMGFFAFTGFINGWVFAVPIIGLFFLLIGREAQ